MHFHTKYSDGKPTPRNALRKARELGIGLAITDHNEAKGAVLACRYAEKSGDDTIVIPGIEVTSKEGCHILVYFYSPDDLWDYFADHVLPAKDMKNPNFKTKLPAEKVLGLAKKYNGITCSPHPYAPGWVSVINNIKNGTFSEKIFSKFDVIEAMTGASLRAYNLRSSLLAYNLGKPMSGGTDGHFLYEMGKVLTCIKEVKTREEFLDALLKKRSVVVGKEVDIMRRIASHSLKMRLQVKHAPRYVMEYAMYAKEFMAGRVNNIKKKKEKKLENIKKMERFLTK
jgi:predicted metal-dependent phosphoesterase TrpH